VSRFLRCRSRAVSKTVRVLALFLVLVFSLPNPALADDINIRDVMDGNVEGVTVQVNGSGLGYYGDSLRASFVNTTGQPITVTVPIGMRFIPNDSSVQTMIAAGGERIMVPAGESEALLKAFCGEMHDSGPNSSDVFTAGERVTGDLLRTVENLNREGRFDNTGNRVVWSFTDDLSLEDDPEAQDLVRTNTSRARTAIGGAITGAAVAGAAIVHARTSGSGSRPPASPHTPHDILEGSKATEWLINDGAKTITHDGETYVLPPSRLPPNTGGIAYETISIKGVDVIDENKIAILPHRDEPAAPPHTPATAPPASAPVADTAPATPADSTTPDNVKLTQDEQQHIIDWGVRNQRSPEDIQRDLDAQNVTRGGSGTVPVANMPVRLSLPQGDVTVTPAEAAAHRRQVADIESHSDRIRNVRRELEWTQRELDKWVKEDVTITPGQRAILAVVDIFEQNNRMTDPAGHLLEHMNRYRPEGQPPYSDVNDLLEREFNRPRYRFGTDYDQSIAEWERGPDAARFHQRTQEIRDQALRRLQDIGDKGIYGTEAKRLYNRSTKMIEVYNKYRGDLVEELRVVNAKKAALREMERQLAERIKKAP